MVVAADARLLGYGGIDITHQASGLDRKTIAMGIRELETGVSPPRARVRQKGGGRKKLTDTDTIIPASFAAFVLHPQFGSLVLP